MGRRYIGHNEAMQESDRHGRRLDEQLKHETEHLVDGAPTENRDEGRREQAPSDDQPDLNPGDRPELDLAPGRGLSEHDVKRRSELARHLRASMFPASRDALLADAQESGAPDHLLEQLRRLPADRPYENVQAMWEALGGPVEGSGQMRR